MLIKQPRLFTSADPRYYQLSVQAGLILWGTSAGYFNIPWHYIPAVLLTALLCQLAFTGHYKLPPNLLSTFNTSLSILLLLHAGHWLWMALATLIAISSKFWLRYANHHIFNPSNLGIVIVLLATESAWVAHGKWGQALWLALLLAGSGLVWRLGWRQMATSLVFLVSYAGLLLLRALWLGDPLTIPLHQLQNGALLIFTFFMLSDPMTTPAALYGKVLYGLWVAVLAAWLQFYWFIPNAFLYALALSSPLVLLINPTFQGERFRWIPRSTL